MLDRDELTQDLNAVLDGLDAYCRSGDATGRTVTKAVDDDDVAVEGDDQTDFPSSVEGLAAFAQSPRMRDLKRDDPEKFRAKYLDFVLNHQLVAKGLVTAQQVSSWSHQLSLLQPVRTHVRSTPGALSKATSFVDTVARPWDFPPTARGLEAFLHSDEMLQLQRERPAYWRRLHLDFYASLIPSPLPQEVSVKRQALELVCPDDPTRSVVAKSLPGGHLSHGQSVLVQNFGPALGDPAQWLR